jgi:hypothetical protein
MAITHVAASAHRGGGNRGPAFMDYEINNFLDILGDVMPIGPLEWALVVDHHKVLFGNKNRDMQSLQRKFNALAGTTPSTGDAVIPPLVQKAKDVQRAIEIKMDSGWVGIQDLGIDGGGVGFDGDGGVGFEGDVGLGLDDNGGAGLDGDIESEEEVNEAVEGAAGVGANLVNEFGINEEQLHNELHCTPVDANTVQHTPTEHNNQQQGVLQQQVFRPVRQQNNIPPALNQCLMVPQVPQQQQQPVAPYQAFSCWWFCSSTICSSSLSR